MRVEDLLNVICERIRTSNQVSVAHQQHLVLHSNQNSTCKLCTASNSWNSWNSRSICYVRTSIILSYTRTNPGDNMVLRVQHLTSVSLQISKRNWVREAYTSKRFALNTCCSWSLAQSSSQFAIKLLQDITNHFRFSLFLFEFQNYGKFYC